MLAKIKLVLNVIYNALRWGKEKELFDKQGQRIDSGSKQEPLH